jgi:hypothetical protein
VTQGGDDLLAGGGEPGLGQVIAEEVDRRHQRLRLERQEASGAREIVAVGIGVDLDLVAGDLGIEHVGAAAEVDDVEDLEVLAQLLDRDVQLVEHPLHRQSRLVPGGADQEAGQRDQTGEALRADHRLGTTVGAPAAVRLRERAGHGLGHFEPATVTFSQQAQTAVGLLGEIPRLQQQRVLAPAEHPRDQLACRRVLGLVDRAAARGPVGLPRLAQVPVLTEVALHEPGDSLAQEHLRGALDLPHLPVAPRAVVAAIEVLGRGEVVLGLGRVGDLALDP